ncbi:aminotransferase class I/II-fold pyridoxal phosphate-dependent enzyme, partial [Halorubrum sp. SD626R]|uniref:aminotransferase class I/II-fold pyridoxal phosphate-dependent enzyme n=1 Tax=Halorubrum sp. SD626R TaxID=1419722 RepID=UPI001F546B90
LAAIETVADATAPETLVVVDEAYGEFAEVDSAIPLVDERDDVAVLRTFSKAYGLAGLRIGYSVVPEEWGEAYARVNTPFAANELACRAALAALDDEEHVAEPVETARWARGYIAEELDAPTVDSAGNFVLARVGDAERVAEHSDISEDDEDLIELSNGCICCELRGDLLDALAKLAQAREFDYLVIESTGVAEPLPVAQTLTMGFDQGDLDPTEFYEETGIEVMDYYELDTTVTVVDAHQFWTTFDSKESL